MAKQTFTTGQVLTAAQVNSLQANDFNQTVSVKTANYTLAAADKGTRIEFNTSGSVTCTVNSGLFDAGDTLVIQNRGAGTATITAGTATVNTSASLALAQYSAGTLYFVSDSAALFFGDAAGISASIVDAKGDLIVGTADNTVGRLAVGTNDYVLTAASGEATGLKWAAPAGGLTWTLLNTGGTALTGAATITVSGISNVEYLQVIVSGASASASSFLTYRFNGDTGNNYDVVGPYISAEGTYSANNFGPYNAIATDRGYFGNLSTNGNSAVSGGITLSGGKSTSNKQFTSTSGGTPATGNGQYTLVINGIYKGTAAISSVSLLSGTGNFDAGTMYVWGA